jgi:hypothetical protein
MKNGWIKLALLAFGGLIISIFALGLVNSLGGSSMAMGNSSSATHQMAMDQGQQYQSNNVVGNQGMGYQGGTVNGYNYPNVNATYDQFEVWQMKMQIEELNRRLVQLQYLLTSGSNGWNNNNMFNNNSGSGTIK